MTGMLRLAAILSACVAVSLACSCYPSGNLEDLCTVFPVVIRGKVVSKRIQLAPGLDPNNPAERQFGTIIYKVRVYEVIFGPPELTGKKKIVIKTAAASSLCGVDLLVKDERVFFGRLREDDAMEINLCDPLYTPDALQQMLGGQTLQEFCA